jgi:hypothetical protein
MAFHLIPAIQRPRGESEEAHEAGGGAAEATASPLARLERARAEAEAAGEVDVVEDVVEDEEDQRE